MRTVFCIRFQVYLAHISIIFIHLLNVTMYDFEGNELVVRRSAASNEEEGGVTSVYNLRICKPLISSVLSIPAKAQPLYSRKLHILVRLASTS